MLLFVWLLALLPAYVYSQPSSLSGTINIYTPVILIDTTSCLDKVTVALATGFAVGDSVLIIQMKGAAIDSSNSSAFGSITSNGLLGAGKYEIAAITAINGNIFTLNGNLVNQYYISGFVQLVRIPSYINAAITGSLSCQPWNGSTGGVLILSVQNNLTFNGVIDTRGRGFRGGLISMNPDGGCGGGSPNYYYDVNQGGGSWVSGGAEKGEGIGSVATTKLAGKGPLANGGGGGNKHNTGGGGGSNYTSGGKGGNELAGCLGGNGGLGGISLSTYYTSDHLFLGGGGGCGDDNNNSGTTGENGGGMVIITANSITGNNQMINANGNTVLGVGGSALDGTGGGGGGGTVFIKANSVTNLTVTAIGGSGGNQNGGSCVGTGGGGGTGILLTTMSNLTGLSSFLLPGAAGSFINSACGGGNYFATPGASTPSLGLTGRILIHTPSSSAATLIANSASTACSGQSFQLNAPPGWFSYTWNGPSSFSSTLQNPVINAVTPVNSGNYTLTVVSAGSCSATSIMSLSIISQVPTPTISITNTCTGQALTGSNTVGNFPTATYNWSGPNGFSSLSGSFVIPGASAAMSGVYSLTVTVNGCSSTATTNVLINPTPTPTAALNSPICAGQSLSLTTGSGNGLLYTWNGPGFYTSNLQNPVIAPASPIHSGIYTLTVIMNGCSGTVATQPATVNATPTVAILTASVCSGQSFFFSANASSVISYSWQGPNNFTAITQGFNFANASSSLSGIYTVTITNTQSCTNTAAVNANVVTVPTASLFSNQPVCEGNILNFFTSGGNTYVLSGPNNFFSTAVNPSIVNAGLSASGNYTLVTSVSTCSSAAIVASVSILARPSPTVSNTSPVCAPLGFQLNAGGGVSYSWFGPNNFTSLQGTTGIGVSAPGNSGSYSVIVVGSNGCQAMGITSVTVNAVPPATATGTMACFGQPAVMMASGGFAYAWSGPGAYSSLNQNALIPLSNAGSAGTYTVFVTGPGSCTASATANLGIHPAPIPSITATSKACVNSSITLQGFGGLSYYWSGPGGFVRQDPKVIFVALSTANAGIYTLTATNVYGCSASITVAIAIDDLPYASLSGIKGACIPFCSDFNLVPSVNSSIVSANLQFDGIPLPANSFTRCFDRAGNHPVVATFTSQQGCVNTNSFVIQAYPLPVAGFEYSPQEPVENVDEVFFTNTSKGYDPYSCNWYMDDEKKHRFDTKDFSHLFENTGTYVVALEVTNSFGCKDTVIQKVIIGEEFNLYVPSAFTPNEDGRNETFQPKGKGIVNYQLFVFDRWGEQLFKTTRFEEGWDGTFKGEVCKSDVYVWKIQAVDRAGKTKNLYGHVTLYK
ncbi:MAG: T9SS type B sorting domain-containing protein [Bacteroidota bacterium]